ncbi:hypothetical protein M569_07756 [Genlisea aurea]|uniref:Uncharacterized protein n=1 Tax=Genlisea aurea TaxID=192259 RepID=S8CQ84_9LAMI|nr:hypothetical protein M569_07756 [Genlisea aurea]
MTTYQSSSKLTVATAMPWMGWYADCSRIRLNPEHGEYIAARKTLELAFSLRCDRIILEGDCLKV